MQKERKISSKREKMDSESLTGLLYFPVFIKIITYGYIMSTVHMLTSLHMLPCKTWPKEGLFLLDEQRIAAESRSATSPSLHLNTYQHASSHILALYYSLKIDFLSCPLLCLPG